MKMVISFSLWGNRLPYLGGAIENAEVAAALYAGWTARFYCDTRLDPRIVEALSSLGAEIVMMDQARSEWERVFWRMYPFSDRAVDLFISRDCDSLPSPNESHAVQEWLDSEQPFHIIRDHRAHKTPISGGLFGARRGVLPEFAELLPRWRKLRYAGDEDFLAEVVWPRIREKHVAHDNWKRFTGDECRALPKGETFCGARRMPSPHILEKYPWLKEFKKAYARIHVPLPHLSFGGSGFGPSPSK
jgi:hypothetical protein